MAAFFDLYPVLSLVMVLAAAAVIGLVVWGVVDARRRDGDTARSGVLDELLQVGRHQR